MLNSGYSVGLLLLTLAASALGSSFRPDQHRAEVNRTDAVILRVDSVGMRGVELNAEGLVGRVLIYADGPARLGLGDAPLAALADTVRLRSLPSFQVDLSGSDVHVELVGGQLAGGGVLTLGGSITGGAAQRVAATGRHLVLLKGGAGIRVVDAAAAR